eukprot:3625304-Prymnesium_polylepis.3
MATERGRSNGEFSQLPSMPVSAAPPTVPPLTGPWSMCGRPRRDLQSGSHGSRVCGCSQASSLNNTRLGAGMTRFTARATDGLTGEQDGRGEEAKPTVRRCNEGPRALLGAAPMDGISRLRVMPDHPGVERNARRDLRGCEPPPRLCLRLLLQPPFGKQGRVQDALLVLPRVVLRR